ncbi:hypothetical protein Nepgr_013708 [Nepenthes gracilis]|uniref:Uncharacterized protein n=1 Tax=Nepenthes gracilis TaxID=150966 RepID=A0AAD3SJQ9_NEPGR|nr:hypothetical protein Nepgr_013708 [Nepenthes gracilis]
MDCVMKASITQNQSFQCSESDCSKHARCQEIRTEPVKSCPQRRNKGSVGTEDVAAHANDAWSQGYMEYGCQHYRRRCRIRAPCCNEIFDCRHCHNEVKNNIHVDKTQRHDIPRHQIKQVICSLCGTEQEVGQVCVNCGVCMAKYFCEKCKLFDDDTSRRQYHCDGCGICRIGGRENFFHCCKCRCCYSVVLKNSHPCVEGAMHHDCPVCFEYLFESRNDVTVMPCGHTIHRNCLKEMREHFQYACPLCSKSVCDMSKVWEKIDMEIASTPMPDSYRNKTVSILCNDCGTNTKVQFHIVAQKCPIFLFLSASFRCLESFVLELPELLRISPPILPRDFCHGNAVCFTEANDNTYCRCARCNVGIGGRAGGDDW